MTTANQQAQALEEESKAVMELRRFRNRVRVYLNAIVMVMLISTCIIAISTLSVYCY